MAGRVQLVQVAASPCVKPTDVGCHYEFTCRLLSSHSPLPFGVTQSESWYSFLLMADSKLAICWSYNFYLFNVWQLAARSLLVYNRRGMDHYTAIQWLVHWPLMSGLLHLVQWGGAWVDCARSPPPARVGPGHCGPQSRALLLWNRPNPFPGRMAWKASWTRVSLVSLGLAV